ncbi:MAG: VWA domain-containing protein [Candidatus Hydrogenedentes bacterium]|nr:VWA domain-containing protein [Candidatus Hydrogenedentota bacterium]
MQGFSIQPPFPAAAILGLGALVIGLVVVGYMRAPAKGWARTLLAIVRIVAVLGLTIVLLRPMRLAPDKRIDEKPVFAVLVDASQSMCTEDIDGKARYQAVTDALKPMQEQLQRGFAEEFDVKAYIFSNALTPASLGQLLNMPSPTGSITDIGTALTDSASIAGSRKHAGVLLISDGRENSGSSVQQAAMALKGMKVPVWTVPVGSVTQAKDLYVTARLSSNFLFVKQPAKLKAALSHSGYENLYATVELYREDALVNTQQVMLKASTTDVEFPLLEDHEGVYRYCVKVKPLPGEADVKNNERTVFARVADEKNKVLIVEARPYWDTKFLLRALQKDPNLEVTAAFLLNREKVFTVAQQAASDIAATAQVTSGVAMPRTREDLFKYDCLVFGRGADTAFSAEELKLLKDYLTIRGGSVLFSRGKAYGFENIDLADLEPVEWSQDALHNVRFELTADGKINPTFAFGAGLPADTVIRELPAMVSVTRVKAEKSLSVILARSADNTSGESLATISYQRYGKGKVMTVGSTGLWRWAMTPPELDKYDDVFVRFWTQMIRWLISESDFLPGQDISFRTDQYSYALGDPVRFIVETKFVDTAAYQPQAVLTQPNGETATLTFEPLPDREGSFAVTYPPKDEGEYSAELAPGPAKDTVQRVRFTVYSDSVENRFVAADEELMRQVATVTGGETLKLNQLPDLPDKVRAFERLTRMEIKPKDAWDTRAIFTVLVCLLAFEWFVRRRAGLV